MASKVYKKGRTDISFNMTPMIDCTFQLILFFMLSTQMASADYVKMTVPKPDTSVGIEHKYDGKTTVVLITVAPYTANEIKEGEPKDAAAFYVLRGLRYRPGDVMRMIPVLKSIKKQADEDKLETIVEIKADRRIRYADVEPALRLIRSAKVGKMRLTVKPDTPEDE